jgi:hypothetical protein
MVVKVEIQKDLEGIQLSGKYAPRGLPGNMRMLTFGHVERLDMLASDGYRTRTSQGELLLEAYIRLRHDEWMRYTGAGLSSLALRNDMDIKTGSNLRTMGRSWPSIRFILTTRCRPAWRQGCSWARRSSRFGYSSSLSLLAIVNNIYA